MADGSKIVWTEYTLNAIVGCSKKSEGCRNCYAIGEAWRMKNNHVLGTGENNPYSSIVNRMDQNSSAIGWTGKIHFIPERLASIVNKRDSRLVFVNSLSDLFHESLADDVIFQHFFAFSSAPQHQFQILTKRSARLLKMSSRIDWPDNVWQGVTVEHPSQEHRIRDLASTGARIKWVSFEPLLSGPKPLHDIWPNLRNLIAEAGIHWVVVGGESSKSKDVARYMRLEDARYVLEECAAAGAKTLLKQLGTRWAVASGTYATRINGKIAKEVRVGALRELWPNDLRQPAFFAYPDVKWKSMSRVRHQLQ
ncbi:MAG TPA: DUF5131 family protein [Terriglobales bacterium]|nr:DUF5131 family protein [Terriglobales bacterium]